MALDRSGPVFYVKIGNASSASAQRVPVDIRVVSISFDEEEAKQDVVKLVVDNHDLSNFDTPLFAIGNTVEVQWGYPGAMGKVREATITRVTGSLQLTIECKGKSHVANLIQRTRKFVNMRRSEIAAQLAEERGLGSVALIDPTDVVLDLVLQSRQTDAQFLRELANKEGFDYHEDVNGFHFHARKVGAPPVRRFTYFVDQSGGDVESFSIDGDIAAKPAVIIAAGRDPLSKENFAPYANDASTSGRPTNAATPLVKYTDPGALDTASLAKAEAAATDAATHTKVSSATTKKGAQAEANAAYARAQQKALKVTLQCVGDALIEAKQVIELHGFGKVLDGNYHITSAKHVVGPGYKMTLKTTRDGSGSRAGMAANLPNGKGKDNTATGPSATDQKPFAVVAPNGATNWKVGGSKPGSPKK